MTKRDMHKSLKNRLAEMLGSGRMISSRELMLYSAAFLWATTSIGVFIAGVVAPALAPDPPWAWLLGCSAIGAVAVWSNLTWMSKLDDVRVYRLSVFWLTLSIAIDGAFMFANPLTIGALLMALLAPTVFAAEFFKKRDVIWTMVLIAFVALGSVIVHPDASQSQRLISRVAAFIPIMWAVAFAVFSLRVNTARELAKSDAAADIDPLTGIGNLRAFETRAEEVLSERNARISGETAVLLIDLDDFKTANTLHGHAGGDHVLRKVASALQGAASKSHLVARIGGDEFAVLLENADQRDIGDLAIRYRNAVLSVHKRLSLEGVNLDASIGSAITSEDGKSLEDLMTAADRAMYSVKDRHTAEHENGRRAELASQLPNEFRTPTTPAVWLPAARVEEELDSGFSLRWSKRPAQSRFAGLTWGLGVTVGLFSLLMPDVEQAYFSMALVALLAGYVVSFIAYCTTFQIGSRLHLASDAFTLGSIALIAYLTGGSDSPLWALVYLFIIYEAWFLDARQIWFRLLGPVVVILLPLTYESPSSISVPVGAAMYSGVLVAVGLTLALSYNLFFIAKARAASQHQSTIDARTGLANRREFELRLQSELDSLSYSSSDALAIVMLDLDNFKNVNTVHGHRDGDVLLVRIADALAACARAGDCVARIGGDEFAVIIPKVDADAAQRLARRLVEAVAECSSQSTLVACQQVTASAGFALYGLHGRTFDELVNAADVALMSVKNSGKGTERVSSFVVSL